MKQADLIVKGDHVLTMSDGALPLSDAAIAVKDGKILEIGPASGIESSYNAPKILGGKHKAVIPGLVNAHSHAPMVYLRGLADDLSLMDWLQNHIWPAENRWMSAEFVRDASELACMEMLKAGITAFSDMYFFQNEVGKVASSMGIRAVLCPGVIDFPTATTTGPDDCLQKAEDFIEKWKGHEFIKTGIGLHAAFTCGPDTLRKTRDLALKYEALVHTHVSETQWEVDEVVKNHGVSPVMLFEKTGLFDARTIAAHCVWVTEEEMDVLAKRDVSVAHCIKSNLKLASGIAPVPSMLKKGVRVALGTDGAASNNALDIIDEMSTAARVHKAVAGDATVLDAYAALLMATRRGAEALGLSECGTIEAGKAADLVIIDLNKPHLAPLYGVTSHLVYAARGSDVESVVINGKAVVEEGRVVSVDEEAIIEKAAHWGRRIAQSNSGG